MWKKANGRVTDLQINNGRRATTTPGVGETAGGHRVSGTQEGLESPDRSWFHSKCSCCWREGEIPQLPPAPPHLPMGNVCREPVDWPAGIGHSVKQQSRGRVRNGFEGKHL